MKEFKVAVAQMDIKLGDKETNLKKCAEIASELSKQGAHFLCLPEYFSTGSIPEQSFNLAESIPGDTVNKLGLIAKKNKLHIVTSIIEKEDDKIYNTAILIDSDGKLLAKYRKVHLFLQEKEHVSNGENLVVVETCFGKVGLMICYDAIFPEIARELALQGAEIIFTPANWPNPFLLQWKLSTSARALDNQVWVVAANRVGADKKFTYFGNSCIINPYGDCAAMCKDREEVLIETVNEEKANDFKKVVNFLEDRQPNVYEKNKKIMGVEKDEQ